MYLVIRTGFRISTLYEKFITQVDSCTYCVRQQSSKVDPPFIDRAGVEAKTRG